MIMKLLLVVVALIACFAATVSAHTIVLKKCDVSNGIGTVVEEVSANINVDQVKKDLHNARNRLYEANYANNAAMIKEATARVQSLELKLRAAEVGSATTSKKANPSVDDVIARLAKSKSKWVIDSLRPDGDARQLRLDPYSYTPGITARLRTMWPSCSNESDRAVWDRAYTIFGVRNYSRLQHQYFTDAMSIYEEAVHRCNLAVKKTIFSRCGAQVFSSGECHVNAWFNPNLKMWVINPIRY